MVPARDVVFPCFADRVWGGSMSWGEGGGGRNGHPSIEELCNQAMTGLDRMLVSLLLGYWGCRGESGRNVKGPARITVSGGGGQGPAE